MTHQGLLTRHSPLSGQDLFHRRSDDSLLIDHTQFPQVKNQQVEKPENFNTFQKLFFSDKNFQISRIQFPLQIFDLDRKKFWSIIMEEPVDTLNYLAKNNWTFHASLADDTIHYETKIKFSPDQVTYVERGKDFGIATLYKFITRNGKWYLIRVEYINL